ncbi:MAG: ATP-binding cassette domain-containing protein [Candidatus Magasanikbacteria bacterium]
MSVENTIVRFENVSFQYTEDKPILNQANFSVRKDSKITIVGQNGAGKSTIFKLICGAAGLTSTDVLKPIEGSIHIPSDASIGIALQVMPKEFFSLTISEYFATAFGEKKHNLEKLIADVLQIVDLSVSLAGKIEDMSGGQQARLLLAYALIQKPDILLLDEPTNNLDTAGIEHLTGFLMMYDKTVIVISHDADFLNAFTEGVLNVDFHTKKVEQYVGNYYNVMEEIQAQIAREEKKNAQLRKSIQDRKDKVNFFSHKGGKMRKLASKLKEEVSEAEENMVDVKRDDKTIRNFTIPAQPWSEAVVEMFSVGIFKNREVVTKTVDIKLWKKDRLQIVGPNGVGKSTLLRTLAHEDADSATIHPEIKVGYYRQDFSGLDFEKTVYESLSEMMDVPDNQVIYATGAGFLLTSELMKNTVGALSEGQKGLLCYARFVLQEPGLLILDEPTNHINFRHLPIIAKAIDDFEGTVIIVSHMPDFMEHIEITQTLDLGR